MTRSGREDPPAGILLVDKSPGPTSHDVVLRARQALGIDRVGHTGTLDPFATGLLVLLVGRATRLAEYFHLLPKRYEAVIRLGEERDSHDPEGEVVARSDAWRDLREDDVRRTLEAQVGRVEQRPPATSAKRVGGRRAYRAARRGERVELEPVEVHVHGLELREWDLPDLRVVASVSTGTYVRALARDVGRDLGCGAYLRRLRRTAIGPFRVDEAIPDRELDGRPGGGGRDGATRPRGARIGAADALRRFLPWRPLDPEEAERVGHGARVAVGRLRPPEEPDPAGDDGGSGGSPPVALVAGERLVAVAERVDGELQPRKVLDAV